MSQSAHPRSRGENMSIAQRVGMCAGSSPLTRGKRSGCRFRRPSRRLIPAHAGKTAVCMASMRREPAHPRSRGENALVIGVLKARGGSSPLTRGKRSPHPHNKNRTRLIPAHAGKTRNLARRRSRTPGSSPLTRGKRIQTGRLALNQRLIPAHAGKTTKAANPNYPHAAHPRSRGENGA